MKKKRILYSLRNCNPPERKKRDRINRMDFQKVFPYYSFDKNKIDINLLRRFIIQNNIPCDLIYGPYSVQIHNNKKVTKQKINSRFEILDL